MKKITIFTSSGGGGHLSVSNAIQESLKNDFQVRQSLLLGEILQPIDPVARFSLGKSNFESLYNSLLKRGWYQDSTTQAGVWYFNARSSRIEKLIHEHLAQEKPDLIISVVPLFNYALLKAAAALAIPFILLPTDLDTTTFVRLINHPDFEGFRLALPFDHSLITEKYAARGIPSTQVAITGIPLKQSFYALHNTQDIKSTFNIPDNKKIIMVLMGAQGSKTTVEYARELSKLDERYHLIFCAGKNEKIKRELNTLTWRAGLSYSIIGFTTAIAELMSIADLIITKSGSINVCEAIASELPMILDATQKPLSWERLNHEFVETLGFGYSLKSIHDLLPLVQTLTQDHLLGAIKKKLKNFNAAQKKIPIVQLINELLTTRPVFEPLFERSITQTSQK